MKPQRFALEVVLPVSRERAWALLADTDRLNASVGLPPVSFAAPSSSNGMERPATARLLGVPLKWNESPFEWVYASRYSVARSYERGALRDFIGGVELFDDPNGTRARLWADVMARNTASAPLVAALARETLRKTQEYCVRSCCAEQVSGSGKPTVCDSERAAMRAAMRASSRAKRPFAARVHEAELQTRLRAVEAKLGASSRAFLGRLGAYLRACSDNEALSLRPFELAQVWNMERDLVLRACLVGAREGLLCLQWALLCPYCRVSKSTHDALSDVTSHFHCEWCGIDYQSDFSSSVELRFAVHPAIRRAQSRTFCIGSPAQMPHVWAQARLQPNGSVSWPMPDAEPNQAWRVRVLRSNHWRTLHGARTLIYGDDGWRESSDEGELCVRNETSREIAVVLEREPSRELCVTAAHVSTLSEFRRDFGREVLSPNVQVGVEQVALLFSDLQASTAFYERAGDAPAYGWVRRHFDIARETIEAHRGTVVKTMGDSVMAAFATPDDALLAAVRMREALRPLLHEVASALQNHANDNAKPVLPAIKIGVACGPALIVNTEERLDYFGRTVNIASRLQSLSDGDDIVLGGDCLSATSQETLRAHGLHALSQRVNLRSFDGDFSVWRVRAHGSARVCSFATIDLETMLDNLVDELARGVPIAKSAPASLAA